MNPITEGRQPPEFLISEASGTRSRDVATLLANTAGNGDYTLEPGTVLGEITASGKFVPFNQDAADGSQVAAGILLSDAIVAETVDEEAVAMLRDAEVQGAALTWPADIEAAEKAAAIAQLAELDIIVR